MDKNCVNKIKIGDALIRKKIEIFLFHESLLPDVILSGSTSNYLTKIILEGQFNKNVTICFIFIGTWISR